MTLIIQMVHNIYKGACLTRLWQERTKLLQYIPYSHDTCMYTDTDDKEILMREACGIENIADTVIRQLEVDTTHKPTTSISETFRIRTAGNQTEVRG